LKTSKASGLHWIFLTTGKSTQDVPKADIEKMQAEHLGNFGTLHAADKLLIAGPMADPEKKLRGVVVVRADSADGVGEMFKPDPYVTNGYLKIEAAPLVLNIGSFNNNITPNAMDEFRIVILSRADGAAELNDDEWLANTAYCKSIHNNSELRLMGTVSDSSSPRRAILLFRKLEDAKLKELIANIPSVKAGKLVSSMMPLYMGKGCLDP
jgi:uncharacterized protein YciI